MFDANILGHTLQILHDCDRFVLFRNQGRLWGNLLWNLAQDHFNLGPGFQSL